MNTWIVIPMKALAQAKSRLEGVLDGQERRDFARGLFEHVLERARDCVAALDLAGILVLTNGDEVARMALDEGAEVMRDRAQAEPEDEPVGHLGRIVDAGLTYVANRGGASALVLMADLPHLTTTDIKTMLECGKHHPMVIAPDGLDRGTNALLLAPPTRMSTCFGHLDSLPRHLEAARQARISVSIYRSPSTALDIDRPFDFERS